MIFDFDLVKKSRYVFSGSKIKKLMQNYSIPNIDILVREVIQNSLDAARIDVNNIQIKFKTGAFDHDEFIKTVPRIKHIFLANYKEKSYDYIYLRDFKCTGLVGNLDDTKVNKQNLKDENLYNLVFDAMNPQSKIDAGGSWGIGKSVYYRFGIGLVFYYSRIVNSNGKYESRLIGTFIEDENNPSKFIKDNDSTGIAFFGRFGINGNVIPIVDDREINDFLDIFDIAPYSNDETGTTVIIPFLNKEKALSNNRNSDFFDNLDIVPRWFNDFEKYLMNSIKRWYFPRLSNRSYRGIWLEAYVNDVLVNPLSFEPVFKEMQIMYNLSLEMKNKSNDGYITKVIENRNLGALGAYTYKILNKEDLLMTPPNNYPSPHFFLGLYDVETNRPIVAFSRKTGMIISFEYESKWVDYSIVMNEGQYLLSIFVLNSNLMDGRFEEYVRKLEKADHSSWEDQDIITFELFFANKPIAKIQRAIKKILKEEFVIKEEGLIKTSPRALQAKLGKLLLPPEGFGNGPSYQPNTTKKKHRNYGLAINKKKTLKSVFLDYSFMNGELIITNKILLTSGSFVVDFVPYVSTDSNASIGVESWIEMGNLLPICLKSITIDLHKENKKATKTLKPLILIVNNHVKKLINFDSFSIKLLKTSSNEHYGFKFIKKCDYEVELTIYHKYHILDNSIKIDFNKYIEVGDIYE